MSPVPSSVILRSDDGGRRVILGLGLAIHVRREQSIADQFKRHNTGIEEELNGAGFGLPVDHLVLLERVNADAIPMINPKSRVVRMYESFQTLYLG